MELNLVTIIMLYIAFILGLTITFEFIKGETYVDITNFPLKDRLEEASYDTQLLNKLNNPDEPIENYEKNVLEKAQEQLVKLGDYNIIRDQTDFKNLDERFNNFQVGTKGIDFFTENPYDNLYYLNK